MRRGPDCSLILNPAVETYCERIIRYCPMKILAFALAALFLLIEPCYMYAEDSPIRISGSLRTVSSVIDYSGADRDMTAQSGTDLSEYEISLSSALRMELEWQAGMDTDFEFAYEIIPALASRDLYESGFSASAADPLSYRAYDTGMDAWSSSDSSDVRFLQNLDRAMLSLSPSFADIYIGRQPVAFGSARVINPTDIFTSFAFGELNGEFRAGIDAVRLRVPMGAMDELDLGLVSGRHLSPGRGAYFLRWKSLVQDNDISLMLVLFRENILAGIDLSRSFGDAGFWMEGAWTWADAAGGYCPGENYLRLSTGLDYSFTASLYGYMEYHFNGPGGHTQDDYGRIISGAAEKTAYSDGSVYLLGRHYIAPGFRFQVSPLLSLDAGLLYNVGDGSVLLFPRVVYSTSDNSSLEAGALTYSGHGGYLSKPGAAGPVDYGREFSLYPNRYFVKASFYF